MPTLGPIHWAEFAPNALNAESCHSFAILIRQKTRPLYPAPRPFQVQSASSLYFYPYEHTGNNSWRKCGFHTYFCLKTMAWNFFHVRKESKTGALITLYDV